MTAIPPQLPQSGLGPAAGSAPWKGVAEHAKQWRLGVRPGYQPRCCAPRPWRICLPVRWPPPTRCRLSAQEGTRPGPVLSPTGWRIWRPSTRDGRADPRRLRICRCSPGSVWHSAKPGPAPKASRGHSDKALGLLQRRSPRRLRAFRGDTRSDRSSSDIRRAAVVGLRRIVAHAMAITRNASRSETRLTDRGSVSNSARRSQSL